jgi:hypothetical protein
LVRAAQRDLQVREETGGHLPTGSVSKGGQIRRASQAVPRTERSELATFDRLADALMSVAARNLMTRGYSALDLDTDLPFGAVAIELNGRQMVPAFQFQDLNDNVVYEAFASASERLDGRQDPLGTLSWWLSPNVWLGTEPATLLGTSREDEIEYALNQLANDSW